MPNLRTSERLLSAEMLASPLPVSIGGAQSRRFGIPPGSSLCFSSSIGLDLCLCDLLQPGPEKQTAQLNP